MMLRIILSLYTSGDAVTASTPLSTADLLSFACADRVLWAHTLSHAQQRSSVCAYAKLLVTAVHYYCCMHWYCHTLRSGHNCWCNF
jgi:hypothetical protein